MPDPEVVPERIGMFLHLKTKYEHTPVSETDTQPTVTNSDVVGFASLLFLKNDHISSAII